MSESISSISSIDFIGMICTEHRIRRSLADHFSRILLSCYTETAIISVSFLQNVFYFSRCYHRGFL